MMKKLLGKQHINLRMLAIEALSLLVELAPIKKQSVFADEYIWRYEPCFSCGPNVCYPSPYNYQIRGLWRYFRIAGMPVAVYTGTSECVQGC